MRYESYEQQPNPTCECDLAYARTDGNKRCGAPVYKMHDGRYMCEGHYNSARQREWSMAQVRQDMKAWESRTQHNVPNNGRAWAYRIIARHEAGEPVSAIAMQMAESVAGKRKVAA